MSVAASWWCICGDLAGSRSTARCSPRRPHRNRKTFGKLENWISEHLDSDLKVEALAQQVHMSPRNFARVYAAKRGRTPAKAVEAIRVDAARRRLEETDDRIESIARTCGSATKNICDAPS